jgi:hypothetical protein
VTPRKEMGRLPAPRPTPLITAPQPTGHRRCLCRHHCSECDRHFSSLDAFDSHRTGSYDAPAGSLEGRRCVSPEYIEGESFEEIPGICKMRGSELAANVWRLSEAADEVRHRFGETEPQELALVA